MSTKLLHNLSGEEMQKECIRFGLSGRFTMKEALVELTTALVRNNCDPKTYKFYTSQPLQGYFPYQVVILTDIVETMKVLPTSVVTCALPPRPLEISPLAFTGVTSSASMQAPKCSSVPFFSTKYPPPSAAKSAAVTTYEGSNDEVMKKLLISVEKIQEVLEKALISAGNSEKTDSEFESFTTAALSSSSKCSSLSTETNPFLFSTTTESKSSLASTCSNVSSRNRQGKLWKKSELIEEEICIKFQHGSCNLNRDTCKNSHICARCYFSEHPQLEPDHGSDWCQEDLY